jgi:hypothetical protein
MCESHKIKMSYYCISCAKSICSDCAMFSEAVSYFLLNGFECIFSINRMSLRIYRVSMRATLMN